MTADVEPTDYDSARADITRSMQSKLRYDYNYCEFITSTLQKYLCCCYSKRRWYKRRARRLQRHELAMDQLTRETDFFNFLKLLRTTDFMSKLYLKEYQRSMIPYFKKYQLTELEGDRSRQVFATDRLGSRAQHLIDGEDEELEAQRMTQLNLIETVREITFNEDAANLAIMYEVTGFQGEKEGDDEFWANYESYKSSGWNEQMNINEEFNAQLSTLNDSARLNLFK